MSLRGTVQSTPRGSRLWSWENGCRLRAFPEVVAPLIFLCVGNSPFLLEASSFHFSRPYCLSFCCWKTNCHELNGLKGQPLRCHSSLGQKSGSMPLTPLPRAQAEVGVRGGPCQGLTSRPTLARGPEVLCLGAEGCQCVLRAACCALRAACCGDLLFCH